MTTVPAIAPQFELPWDAERDDVRRFRRWLLVCLVTIAVIGVVVPLLPVPEVDRKSLEELPPQLARIVLEKPKPIVPPPPPMPEVAQEEKLMPEETPEPEAEPPHEVRPEPEPKPQPTVTEAREKAAVSGLLAFQDAFADMRDAVDLDGLEDTGAIQQGKGEAATIDRSLLTSKHGTRSSGVNVSELSRDTGGVALAGRETTKVEAPPEAAAVATATAQAEREGDARQRSIEDVRRVFDANKGAIFAIYNRALRQDPTLQGKVVLQLVIDPSGRVIGVEVVTSELEDESLVAKIVNRVRLFEFGQRNVGTTTISYPVHFLPS